MAVGPGGKLMGKVGRRNEMLSRRALRRSGRVLPLDSCLGQWVHHGFASEVDHMMAAHGSSLVHAVRLAVLSHSAHLVENHHFDPGQAFEYSKCAALVASDGRFEAMAVELFPELDGVADGGETPGLA
jgi:hypothetical protein